MSATRTERFKNLAPSGLPDLRISLIGLWNGAYSKIDELDNGTFTFETGDGLGAMARWNIQCLEEARLWWVSSEMVDLIEAAAKSIPDDYVLHEQDLPSRDGLVLFEKPLFGTDAESGSDVIVDAYVWGPAIIRPSDGVDRHSLGMAAYTQNPFVPRLDYVPLGRSSWPLGNKITEPNDVDIDSVQHQSHVEDRRWIAAMWLLSTQKGLADTRVVEDRAARRRAARQGYDAAVNVVSLPRRDPTPSDPTAESTDRHYSHQWIVRGHWRNQPYGPGRTRRRPTWIAPHVAGPDGTPLIITEQVNALRVPKRVG